MEQVFFFLKWVTNIAVYEYKMIIIAFICSKAGCYCYGEQVCLFIAWKSHGNCLHCPALRLLSKQIVVDSEWGYFTFIYIFDTFVGLYSIEIRSLSRLRF